MSTNDQNRSLVAISEARQLIARAVADKDADTLDELRKQADAYQLYHRRSGAQDVANDAGEIKVRAEAGLGAIDAAENPHGGARTEQDEGTHNLPLGVNAHTRANWRKLGALPPDELDERIERARQDEEYGVSTAALLKKTHVATRGENEWYTPPQYLEAARRVMGGIDLDPASSDKAQELVQATAYYTKDDDGLQRPWSGRVWMNPPYSKDLIYPFCERLCEFYASGDVSEAVVLVNNATETAAFQRMAELASAICFHAKRIKYLNQDLQPAETPVQGQAFLYFGDNIVDGFMSEFIPFGFIATL